VKHARDLICVPGKNYSISLQHLAEAADWIEHLEPYILEAELEAEYKKADRVH
jgi:hypothetical protein